MALTGSVNALETSDPVRDGQRFGAEGGLASNARPSHPVRCRRSPPHHPGTGAVPNRSDIQGSRGIPPRNDHPFSRRVLPDTVRRNCLALMERVLDMEVLDAGFDARPFRGFSLYASGSQLWLSDGNSRSGALAGLSQKIGPRLSLGVFGRRLSFERRGIGYFSPDRFSVLEGTADYAIETRTWGGSIGGGLGAQQVGKSGAAQTEWHVEGRVGRRWGVGNRVELFGLVTNSAVSSTTGAFRYRSAGVNVRLGL